MPVILLLITVSLSLALAFLACFIWAVRSGQFEDTCTPSMRMLTDEESGKPKPKTPLEPALAGCAAPCGPPRAGDCPPGHDQLLNQSST